MPTRPRIKYTPGVRNPKAWLRSLGIRIIILPGGSPYTTLPSAVSLILRQGGASMLRRGGRAAYYGVIIYGLYMAGVEVYCAGTCAGDTCSY